MAVLTQKGPEVKNKQTVTETESKSLKIRVKVPWYNCPGQNITASWINLGV